MVVYHAGAEKELRHVKATQASEFTAVLTAVDKLRHLGPQLPFPHQSGVKGREGRRLRELRPRQGRSRWRPLYRQVTDAVFVILAIAPEAQIDQRGFNRAVRAAQRRLSEIEL
jgi:hypothetical protein